MLWQLWETWSKTGKCKSIAQPGPVERKLTSCSGDYAGVKWINGSCLQCDFCQTSDEPLCAKATLSGYTVDGSFQQYCIAKAAHAARIPKDCALDAIAPVLCAGITVYKGLKESGAKPGQTVAIVGAGGGLGSLAQQYARAMGLKTIAIDSGDEKKKSKYPNEMITDLNVPNADPC